MIKVAKPTPTVRFQDFSDNWEQHKVGELLIERNEQAPQSEEYPLMAFVANKGIAAKGERYDRSALVKDTKGKLYKKTELDDFIYSSNNLESGSIGLNKYGKASISPVYSIFKSSNIADLDFIGRRFIRKDFINNMIRWRQGVIYGQWRIHESDFLKIKVLIPSIDEQRKIGEYFSKLDSLITFYQRKLEQQKQLKQYFLQNMFPADGEKVPRIRFKGFTGDWELRKFGTLAYRESATRFSSDEYPFLEYEDIIPEVGRLNKDICQKEDKKKGIIFDENKVLYGKLRPYLHNWLAPEFTGVAVGDWWVLNPSDTDRNFLYVLIQTKQFDMVANLSTGSKMPRADWKLVSSTNFFVPPVEEQKYIGRYFQELDNLITFHQCKIDQLQTMKKYMLQNMFI